jgi:hypothetical protein
MSKLRNEIQFHLRAEQIAMLYHIEGRTKQNKAAQKNCYYYGHSHKNTAKTHFSPTSATSHSGKNMLFVPL